MCEQSRLPGCKPLKQLKPSDGQRPWWKPAAEGFRGFKGLKAGKLSGSNALTREGYVQAKEGFRHFRGLKPGKLCRLRMP